VEHGDADADVYVAGLTSPYRLIGVNEIMPFCSIQIRKSNRKQWPRVHSRRLRCTFSTSRSDCAQNTCRPYYCHTCSRSTRQHPSLHMPTATSRSQRRTNPTSPSFIYNTTQRIIYSARPYYCVCRLRSVTYLLWLNGAS